MNWRTPILLSCCTLASAAETAAERGKRVVDEALRALGGDAIDRDQDLAIVVDHRQAGPRRAAR